MEKNITVGFEDTLNSPVKCDKCGGTSIRGCYSEDSGTEETGEPYICEHCGQKDMWFWKDPEPEPYSLLSFIKNEQHYTDTILSFALRDKDIDMFVKNLEIPEKKLNIFEHYLKNIQLDSFKAGIQFAIKEQLEDMQHFRNKLNREISSLKKVCTFKPILDY